MGGRWRGPIVVGLAIFLLMGATIHKAGLIVGSTVVSGGTANVVLMTNSAGALANTSPTITADGTNVTVAGTSLIVPAGTTTVAGVQVGSSVNGLSAGSNFLGLLTIGTTTFEADQSGTNAQTVWPGTQACFSSGVGTRGNSADACLTRPGVGQILVRGSTSGTQAGFHVTGGFHAQTGVTLGAHVVTIAAEGTAAVNNEILAGDRSVYLVDCNDGNGCVVRLGTNVSAGSVTNIVNISTNSNTVTIDTVANVQHVFSLYTMSTNHAIGLMFTRNRSGGSSWVETSRNGRGT